MERGYPNSTGILSLIFFIEESVSGQAICKNAAYCIRRIADF